MLATFLQCACQRTANSGRLVVFQQVRRGRFAGRNTKEQYRRRSDELKDTKKGKQVVPYEEDLTNLRPPRDLLKAFGFTVGVGVTTFTVAAIRDYEMSKIRWKEFVLGIKRMKKGGRFSKYRRLRDGIKCTYLLVGINMIVMLMWGIRSLQLFMWRWFTNSFASKALCLPMILSAFSHANMLHLVLNMYVLNTFAPVSIDRFFGVDQFWAFYITACAVSSLAGMTHKCLIGSNRRALGASGAILALLVYTCVKIPDARLQIVFIPQFDFSAKSAVIGMITFDTICLLMGFKLFDHAAHLGGSLFGLFYGTYGHKWLWKNYGDWVLKWYRGPTEEPAKRNVRKKRRRRHPPKSES